MNIQLQRLTQLAFGYWRSSALFALIELGIVQALVRHGETVAELANKLTLDPDAVRALCAAGVTLGVLEEDGGWFTCSAIGEELLDEASPHSLVHWFRTMASWQEPWAKLPTSARGNESGRPSFGLTLSDDPDYERDFILGMHEFALLTAIDVARAIAPRPRDHVIDIGGGAGTYSAAMYEIEPSISLEVLDRPSVLPIAREVMDKSGVPAASISTRGFDYRRDALDARADLVLLSNVLHQESSATRIDILRRAAQGVIPAGRIVVHGHFLDEGRVSPQFAVLHALSALVLWEGGHGLTTDDLLRDAESAGLSVLAVTTVPASGTCLVELAKDRDRPTKGDSCHQS